MSDDFRRIANLSPNQRRLLEQRLSASPAVAEPVAIIGMSCRFPGAPNLDAFWQVISQGVEATAEIPANRWNLDDFYDPTGEQPGKMSVRRAALVADVDQFDAAFFGIAPREAGRMDPQQRLLLEVAWEAFEIAGMAPDQMGGSATGVFVGIGGQDYSRIPSQYEDYFRYVDAHSGTGSALSIAANRVSYALDLRGPSVAVDTACSSSSMAIHWAIQSLRNRECDAALAGGVNLILSPETTIAFSKAHMLSPDGRCRPFDAQANGYVRGEGCALLVLKRLTDAVRDRDPVLAVIRASAVNQDGRTSGITAPNARSQQAVIRSALAQAQWTPDRIDYIEAHGTATPLGDPIEMESLTKIFRRANDADPICYVSSVKANIGHTETASGVAGIIKVVLMMRHGIIPAQLHFQSLNQHISLESARLAVPTQSLSWSRNGRPRTAGVSSFGFGGTNTHILLEESIAPVAEPVPDRPRHVLTLSAKTAVGLSRQVQNYHDHLANNSSIDIGDLCFTANTGRTHFQHRLAVVAKNRDELQESLAKIARAETPPGVWKGQPKNAATFRIAFLFTGQGAQYAGMGRALYESHPLYRRCIDECNAILQPMLGRSLLSVMFPNDANDAAIHETAYTQPALFAHEYALANVWRSWGIEPAVVLGHSVGEYVAACVAGSFRLDDGLKLIAHRARLMQSLPQNGKMVVAFCDGATVQPLIDAWAHDVSFAALNGPENTVISGRDHIVDRLAARLEANGIRTQPLRTSHAFHSPLMEPMLDEFERWAAECEFQPNAIPLISNVTGSLMEDEWLGPDYWRRHVRQPVRFAESVAALEAAEVHAVIEIGPSPTLIGMARRCAPAWNTACLPSLRPGRDDWSTMLGSLAELYSLGANVDWKGFDREWQRRKIMLPTYPFERTRHWFEPKTPPRQESIGGRSRSVHPLLGGRIPAAVDATLYEVRLSSRSPGYLCDHQVQSSPVFPAAAYVEQALAAAGQSFGVGDHVVCDLTMPQAMLLHDESCLVQVSLSPEQNGERAFEISSLPHDATPNGSWTLHARGKIRHAGFAQNLIWDAFDLDEARSQCGSATDSSDFYQRMRDRGLNYGTQFQTIQSVRRGDDTALVEFQLTEAVVKSLGEYRIHPTLGDTVMQSIAAVIPLEADGAASPYTYLPNGVRAVQAKQANIGAGFIWVRRTSPGLASPEIVEADASVLDAAGREVARWEGIRLQRVGRPLSPRAGSVHDWLYRVEWIADPVETPSKTANRDWLIFADQTGLGEAIAKSVASVGRDARIVTSAAEYHESASDEDRIVRIQIDPHNEDHYRRLIERLPPHRDFVIAHLGSLDSSETELATGELRGRACESALLLIRQLARGTSGSSRRLLLVTRGVHAIGPSSQSISVDQAPMWGLGRVAAIEHPELGVGLVDLDPAATLADSTSALLETALETGNAGQIAFRDGKRYRARLVRSPEIIGEGGQAVSPESGDSFRVRLVKPGSFDELRIEKLERKPPAAGQIEVEVRAAGVNFSDVLKVMGLYPGISDPIVPLGIEASGVVTAVGEGVSQFQVGDEVLGVVPFSLASHAVTAEYALTHKPAAISHAEAATIPIAFLTAHYALCRLGRLRRGERVLIHAGAGGVGLAAIQIAQRIGAEIFATAGSDEKRAYLRALGVPHVFSTRSLDFAEQILQATNREGVDVVLNSLPGEAIAKSLSILRAYGRFLEIGKIDIYQNRAIGLWPFQDNLSYFAIDLDRMLRQRPDDIRALFHEVMQHFEAGDYRPLPLTEFSARDVAGALRYMSQRKNTGKVIVSFPPFLSREPQRTGRQIRSDGTYLITGGLGAIGLHTARWLTSQGARHIALMSRRPPSPAAETEVAELQQSAAQVAVLNADVTNRDSMQTALQSLPLDWPPLRGVFHAAGVLDDGVLFDMSIDRFRRALKPKVDGAWNLHQLTLDAPIDFFVLFSSVASVLGSPGQANYAAGNAFLDSLAEYRRQRGLPSLSVNWGPWAEGGMAAFGGRADQLQSRGMTPMASPRALEALHGLLESDATSAVVADVRWGELLKLMAGRTPSLLSHIADAEALIDPSAPSGSGMDAALRQKLMAAPREERRAMLRQLMAEQLARITGIDAAQIDVDQPLNTLGLDSLMAMELKTVIESKLGFSLPMARFFSGPTVGSLADDAAALLSDGSPTPAASWSPLVLLEPGGEQAPLYCVHPIGGDVRCYFEFARHVGGERPVYALAARGLNLEQEPHGSMTEMINDYATAIESAQPSGPVHLVGWSTGGIYAYALADELRRRGRAISLLALVDCPHPALLPTPDLTDEARFLCDYVEVSNHVLGAKMEVEYDTLKSLDPQSALEAVLAEAKKHQMVPSDASIEFVRRFIEVGRSTAMMLQEYSPPGLDVPVHQFVPTDDGVLSSLAGRELPPDRGWGNAHAFHRAAGNHFSMLTSANAASLAHQVRGLLSRVSATRHATVSAAQ